MKTILASALQNIENQFGITSNDGELTFDAIVEYLIPTVTYEMTYNLEHFFSLLYRLDISESAIKAAINHNEDVPKKIATLIVERQIEKVIARNQFKTEKPTDDLAW